VSPPVDIIIGETLIVTPTRIVEVRIRGVPAQIPPSDDTCAAQAHGASVLEMLKRDREKGSLSGQLWVTAEPCWRSQDLFPNEGLLRG